MRSSKLQYAAKGITYSNSAYKKQSKPQVGYQTTQQATMKYLSPVVGSSQSYSSCGGAVTGKDNKKDSTSSGRFSTSSQQTFTTQASAASTASGYNSNDNNSSSSMTVLPSESNADDNSCLSSS